MNQGREQGHAAGLGLAGDGTDADPRTGNGIDARTGYVTDAGARSDDAAPTQQLGLAASAGDRCVNCGAPLASDQRYCVNCGERRGKPRFALAEPAGDAAAAATPAKPSSRRPRVSSGFTLIAGIATLLLAMGVGVLIGHNSAGSQPAAGAQQPVKIDLNGGGSAAAASTPTTAVKSTRHTDASARAHSRTSAKPTKATKSKPTSAQSTKASGAASKVLGGQANTAPATVTQGAQCQSGTAGCQNGKFTGNNFFGQ
jgi:hypothetical protein